jgi:hypothetical protein
VLSSSTASLVRVCPVPEVPPQDKSRELLVFLVKMFVSNGENVHVCVQKEMRTKAKFFKPPRHLPHWFRTEM